MRKTYRFITLSLVLALVLFAVMTGVQTTKAQTPTVITIWTIAVNADAQYTPVNNAINRFNAAHTDMQVKQTVLGNDSKSTILTAAQGGTLPDAFQTWGGGQLQDFISSGVVRDIPELLGADGAKFAPASMSATSFNGKHYAVPLDVAGVFLWTNVDMLKANSLPTPDTWTNFIADCKALSAKGIVPVQLGNKDKWPGAFWMTYLVDRLGGPDTFNNAFNRINGGSFTDPVFIKAGHMAQDATDAGCWEKGFNGTTSGDQSLIGTGKAVMQLQGTWDLGGLDTVNKDLTTKSIRALPFPTVDGGKGDPSDMVGGTGEAYAVNAKASPAVDAALIEMFGSPEYAKDAAAAGLIPANAKSSDYLTDPIVVGEAKAIAAAKNMQLYYDQFLPPALSDLANQTVQDILGKNATPEDAFKAMEDTATTSLTPATPAATAAK